MKDLHGKANYKKKYNNENYLPLLELLLLL